MNKSTFQLTLIKIFALLFITTLPLSIFSYRAIEAKQEEGVQVLNPYIEFDYNELESILLSLEEAQAEIDSLQSEIHTLKKYESSYYDYKSQYEELQAQFDELQVKYEELQAQFDLLQSKLDSSQSNSNQAKKVAYLTFDDGPSNESLEMLKVLDQYNIKATFFVTKGSKNILQEIHNKGHLLANHSSHHDYATLYANKESFAADVKELDDYIYEITGLKMNLFRFPGGSKNTYIKQASGSSDITIFVEALTDMGYQYFDWNVDSKDASGETLTEEQIASNVLEQCKDKKVAVILMHSRDSKHTTTLALPTIIEGLIEQGFTFDLLSPDMDLIQFKR